jgi:hypothetical protein
MSSLSSSRCRFESSMSFLKLAHRLFCFGGEFGGEFEEKFEEKFDEEFDEEFEEKNAEEFEEENAELKERNVFCFAKIEGDLLLKVSSLSSFKALNRLLDISIVYTNVLIILSRL